MDIQKANYDFYIKNVSKWLMDHKGEAVIIYEKQAYAFCKNFHLAIKKAKDELKKIL